MGQVSRFKLKKEVDLSKDNTDWRIVLSPGTEYANGELAEWLLGRAYPNSLKMPFVTLCLLVTKAP